MKKLSKKVCSGIGPVFGIIIAAALVVCIAVWGIRSYQKGELIPEKTQEVKQAVREKKVELSDKNDIISDMKAIMKTNKGDIEITLDGAAPNTVENFVKLAEQDFYNNVKFHRVIKGFMIQGGDPLSKDEDLVDQWGTGGPGYKFEDEIHAANANIVGSISMANAGPNTNGSQFFINTADNGFLNPKHTVFGNVSAGMNIVAEIENVETFPNDRPVDAVEILSIEIIK